MGLALIDLDLQTMVPNQSSCEVCCLPGVHIQDVMEKVLKLLVYNDNYLFLLFREYCIKLHWKDLKL